MIKEISYGSFYNVPVKVYYIEDDTEVASLPTDVVPAIAMVNNENGFHCLMLDSNGNWNRM